MIEEKTRKILKQIEQGISECKMENISLVSGYIGIVLFYERYSKIEPKMKSKLEKSINELIKLSYDAPNITYSNGLSGVGWLFSYLISEEVIDVEDSFFNEIDNQVHKDLHIYLNSNNFDFLHGAIGIGMYLLERKKHSLIGQIIDNLETKSVKSSKGYSWLSFIYDNDRTIDVYELSLSHGNASIISFLSLCIKENEFYSQKAKMILDQATRFILNNKIKNEISNFPAQIYTNSKKSIENSRLAWCNGDLGIALALWNAGSLLNNTELLKEAEKLFLHTTHRKKKEVTSVIDAGICHGSAGIAQIYYRMFQGTGKSIYMDSYNYWINETIKYSCYNDGIGGYKSWGGKHKGYCNDYGLLGGVAGVGVVLASSIIRDSSSWQKAFLIS